MTLPNDVARCHDAQCAVRDQCQRWQDRERGGQRVIHCVTLKPGYVPHHRPCSSYIGEVIVEDEE